MKACSFLSCRKTSHQAYSTCWRQVVQVCRPLTPYSAGRISKISSVHVHQPQGVFLKSQSTTAHHFGELAASSFKGKTYTKALIFFKSAFTAHRQFLSSNVVKMRVINSKCVKHDNRRYDIVQKTSLDLVIVELSCSSKTPGTLLTTA